jgi:hypothetical protein
MCGKARDMFVRSMKAMVYIISATGMMRIQRIEVRGGLISVLAPACSSVGIEITEARECDRPDHKTGYRCANPAKYWLGLYLEYTNFGVLILVMRDGEIVAI